MTGTAPLPGGASVSANNRQPVSTGKPPPPVAPKPSAPPLPPKFHAPTAPVFVNNRLPVSTGKTPPPVAPKPSAPPLPPKFHAPTAPVFVNNRLPVSTGKISIQDTPQPSSPEGWATKLKDAILRQQAGGTLTTKEKDFSGANLSEINLNDFLPPNFKGSNNQIIINGFDFSNANLSFTDFSDINFEECKFTNSNIFNAILKNTKFSNLDLSDTNRSIEINHSNSFSFSNVILKNAIIKPGVNLSGVISNEPDNSPPEQESYIRLGDFWLDTPVFWDEYFLDTYLNHEHNEGRSMLTTIDSLPDKYNQEKVQAMEELVKSLDTRSRRERELRPVVSSLVSILDRPPYTQSVLISEWLGAVQASFLAHYCKIYNEAPLPVPGKYFQQYTLPALLNSFEKDNATMTTHSAFFNQVILHSMTGADCTDDARQKAAALYEQYLAHPAVSPHINNGLFGNYDGSPDWTTRAADNFVLLSSRTPDTAMMLSADTLLTMLNPTPDTSWDHFYLLKGGENIPSSQISPSELFRHDFKVFSPAYNKEAQTRNFGKLIDTILSPEEHSELNRQFIEATNQKHSTVKFVDDASVSRLNAVFDPLLPEGRLSPAHYQHILSAYYLNGASPQEQAKTLFCLSTTFARYSSSAIFGTENDSPPVLRGYAEALMQKAWELSPEIFPSSEKFTDWSNRLHGLHGAFTCSSVVASDMQTHAREHFPDVLSSIQPLAWA
ncbi:type III secretion system effector HECT-type E3 ubiquitin transferase [Salmonella enterica]|nr:type III secretion system effector HECT-type E3 ubiquitin transferase [Salmonella enterica]ELL0231190.1 type III secretion system effector HECT-type E3 ubiquitin transferase [Salmonella enterica]